MVWRRSYDTPPPPIEPGSRTARPATRATPTSRSGPPLTECLKDIVARFVPYWDETIEPELRAGKTVLIAAHGNCLRALVKHLDGMCDADIVALNIPTGMPLVYELDATSSRGSSAGSTWTPRRPRRVRRRWPPRAPSSARPCRTANTG